MPATAAIDNETLDHLLSVVNDAPNIEQVPRFGSGFYVTPHRIDRVRLPPEFPHRHVETFKRQWIHATLEQLAHHLD